MKRFLLIILMAAFGLSAHAQEHYWPVNTGLYPDYAILNSRVELDGVEITSNTIELGAFCGDEIRGSEFVTSQLFPPIPGIGELKYYFPLKVYGESGNNITFLLYDHDAGVVVSATCGTTYSWDQNGSGTPINPFVISFTSAATYTITATANPVEGGTITGAGAIEQNTSCTLTATPNTGYHFLNWTQNGTVVSTEPSFTFIATSDSTFVANFGINSYEITATANPTEGGTVSGGGTFNYGTTCTLTATPATGYQFVNWTKNGTAVSTDASYSFTVTETADYIANFSIYNYDITATANPTEGGTVSGAGSFSYGVTCTLTATPATGYHFVNWTKDGNAVSTDATYSFTVVEAGAYVANFAVNTYDITVLASPTDGGIVTGGSTYNHGATCTLTATANEGYHFVNWLKNNQIVSDNPSYSFTVGESATYVAIFQLNSYEITASVNPENTGTVTGAGTYNHFETCELVATPATGYHFVNWTKDGIEVSTEATYSFTVIGAEAYVANFAINTYDITVVANPTEGGTVTNADGNYTHGATITLTATANDGYHFVNWTFGGEVISTNASDSFQVTAAGTYVGNFELNTYEITATANPTDGGTITGADTYSHGATCTLTATANEGYTFVNWTKGSDVVSTDLTYSFTVVEAAAYVANFQINSYTITVDVNNTEWGTVMGDGTFNHGATCTLTATPAEGYHFVNWTLNGEVVSTSNPYIFEVHDAGNYNANFAINTYEITATANPTAGGTVTGAGTFNHGETCTLTATVNTGYTFINWTLNGEVVTTDLSFSFQVTDAASYVANYQLNSYDISVSANPAVGGNVTGGGTYNYGTSVTLTANASEGYTFLNWTRDGSVVSTSPNYSITVTEDASYVANFSLNSYQITATANPNNGGTVSGDGTYDHFEICTLIATPDPNYLFLNWTLNGSVVSTSPNYSFTVTGAASYVANFVPNEFTISATAQPSNGGTVTGNGVYNYGTTCTLIATPNIGFHFVNWTKDGVVVSTNTSYSFTVTEDGSYVAHFDHNDCVITAAADPTVGGTITGAGTYHYNQICTLSATANAGYSFGYWTKDGVMVSNRPAFSITVTEDAHYVAHFVINNYYVTVTANPTNGGNVTGEGAYQYGETCTVTAFAANGYHFVRWTKNGTQVSTDVEYSFTVTEDSDVVGYFALDQCQIEAVADPANAGSITGTGTYSYGATATLNAAAHAGYAFVNWTKDGNVVSTSASYSFTVTESASYVAHFTSSTHVVTTGVYPSVGGHATGAGTYAHGASCTVNATPNDGYVFVNWTISGQQVSTQPSYTFTVNENTHLTAHFVIESCTITAEASPEEGGEVTGMGVFEYGEVCTLEATPNDNYIFVKWTKDGVTVSETPLYSFTVTGTAHYVAEFQNTEGVGENVMMTINIFPNPVVDKVIVETSETVDVLQIYNINGALVYEQKNCSDRVEINVSDFAIGTYMIRLISGDVVEVRRFVKE